ncbi:Dolichyl-phosphate-mannose-protein mannosyltransferase-domain-containing protein [Absidia repens]|uniref:Dolichyl-phosphate-mannose--protein mannosyltransferase n=1 Tax=Absidia repens TaxID=90262 RepID=A0A1X2J2A4_9FUNG|nr:Dolichyl-phosphate-mannose-protein mannosyltransferase-domain-containing protein [Absidia repens]
MADTSLRNRRQPTDEKSLPAPPSPKQDNKKVTSLHHRQEQQQKLAHRVTFVGLTILSFFVSFYKIWYPAEVVFDEVHFGKFAGYYLRRSYFFDVHPPLAKMMIAAVGYLIGYDGHFEFTNIGDNYIENNVPYVALRSLPATLNVLCVCLVYSIMKQSGYSLSICALTAGLMIFDNSLVGQHRLIMLDSMLIFFMLATVYCYIRFRKVRYQEFSSSWWIWLVATGVNMALTLSVKMVGLFLVATIGIAVLVDLWALFDIRRGLDMSHFMRHFYARAIALIIIPIAIYLFWFYVHFAILVESGPGDSFMSTHFKETLKNSATKMKSLEIHYYDNITLLHRDTDVYLHSHDLEYPLRYDDGRISSKGQQVVGTKEFDVNSWWQVLPTKDIDEQSEERVKVHHDDIIRLRHLETNTILLTHDVASPLLSTNEEITTVDPDTRYNETLFRLILEDSNNNDVWQTHLSPFKLLHMDTKVAVWTHDQALPDWGLGLQDVNGNKNTNEKSNFWVAQEIMGKNATEINMNKKQEIKSMLFLRKFLELQGRMLSHNAGLTKPHPYQSTPISWPFLVRGISYWSKNDTREQIYMTGNLIGWYLGIGSVAVYAGILLADTLARHRGIEPIDGPVRQRFLYNAGFFALLWLLHYGPFFLMGRALFLHHYLPAAVCNYMLLGAVLQFMLIDGIDSPVSDLQRNQEARVHRYNSIASYVQAIPSTKSFLAFGLILVCQIAMFLFLAPLTYGSPGLSVPQVLQHKIYSSWDLQYAK